MNVAQLIDKLAMLPRNLEVMIKDESEEFDYVPLEEMMVKKIFFSEENGCKTEPYAEEECLVLGEN